MQDYSLPNFLWLYFKSKSGWDLKERDHTGMKESDAAGNLKLFGHNYLDSSCVWTMFKPQPNPKMTYANVCFRTPYPS